MRRIAIVTPILPVPHDQTRGRYIHETARALSRLANVRVFFPQVRYPSLPGMKPRSFLAGEVGPSYKLDGIDLEAYTYPAIPGISRGTNGLVGGIALAPRLAAFAPDLVIGYWVYPDGYAAVRAARHIGVPCVVGARGSDIHVRSGVTAWWTRRALKGADAVLTVSQAMRRAAISEFGVPPHKVNAVINGIDTQVFHPRNQEAMRHKLGVPKEARLIVYVGRFVASKGMHELVQAFKGLCESDHEVRLALVGDGVMRVELLALLQANGLDKRVFMPGGLVPEQVAEWIAASDVLTLPSWSEGYPNVVVEAIACGRPVVATDVGGTNEIVDERNGILIAARDARALEDALRAALRVQWDHGAMADAIRRDWNDVATDTLAVCEALLATRI